MIPEINGLTTSFERSTLGEVRWVISFVGLSLMAIGFAESDSIAARLPQTWWFVAAFVAAGIGLVLLVGLKDPATRERDPVVRAFIRLTDTVRSKAPRG